MSAAHAAFRPGASAQPVRVAAAADLTLAFRAMADAFEKRTGHTVSVSFGATGLLEKQITEGAPFDVFAAADVAFVDAAIQSGACIAESRAIYATGRLALVVRRGALAPTSLADLAEPRFAKVGIASPEHAPYGKAAKQALLRAGVWESVHGKLKYGEDVQQALGLAQSGGADASLVALSLVSPLGATRGVTWLEVPSSLYDPIVQALVVCARGKAGVPLASAFAEFVRSDEGRALLERHGFLPP